MNSTFEDVKIFVETTAQFSEAYKKKLGGRLSTYAKKSNRTLAAIPADLALFEQEFGKGRREVIPHGYKTKQQVNTAASEIRSALKAFLETQTPSQDRVQGAKQDDWDTVRQILASEGVDKEPIIGVDVLITKCRAAQKQPHEVTHNFLMKIIRGSVTAGEYKAIQRGWGLIELHAAAVTQQVILPDGVPFPSLAKTRNTCRRYELPALLQKQFSTWADMKENPSHAGVVQRDSTAAQTPPKTISSVHEGLTYYHTCLVNLGYLDAHEDVDLFEIIDLSLLEEVVLTELRGGFAWDNLSATTLHGYIKRPLEIAENLGMDCAHIRKEILGRSDFKGVMNMSPKRRLWCQRLLADRTRVRAFYNLPAATFKTAVMLMQDYENMSEDQRKRAIKTSIAACAFAILLSLPLRMGTMLRLKHSGLQANVFALEHKSDLIISTTADMVKNGYEHERVYLTPKAGGNPKKIVKWFIENVHRRLLQDHVKPENKNPNLLFAGIPYHRLLNAIVDNAVEHGIDLIPHLIRHGIATLLANEPRADYALIAALLGDTPETVIKNYIFVDQARLHVAGQQKLAISQNNALRFAGGV